MDRRRRFPNKCPLVLTLTLTLTLAMPGGCGTEEEPVESLEEVASSVPASQSRVQGKCSVEISGINGGPVTGLLRAHDDQDPAAPAWVCGQ